MELVEIFKSVRYVVNRDGQETAVQLDLAAWRALVALLEDLEDAAELKRARQEDDILVDWEEVVADYLKAHPELNPAEADV
jgi:hypothetical protein